MSHGHHQFCCPPAKIICDPPRQVIRDFFHPQLVEVVHQVEIVNRHHCVPVYKHVVAYSERDEFGGMHTAGYRKEHPRAQVSQARRR